MTTSQAQLTAAHLEKALEENSRLGDGEPTIGEDSPKKNHGRLSSGSISITAWWFGTWLLYAFIFPYIGNVMIPTD